MPSQLDSYSMLICSKYVKSIEDMINITLVNSKFKENIDKFHFNPFQIDHKSRKYFSHLQTQWLFSPCDDIFEDGDIIRYYVLYEIPYDEYLEMKNNFRNIKFRRIIYTKYNCIKYGDKIPNVVNKLGSECFHASSAKEIKIPDSVVEIYDAFVELYSLTSITISSRLTSIGDYSFHSCNQLSSIKLPSVLTFFDKDVFCGCERLTSIEYSPYVVNLNDGLFIRNGFSAITIPTSITRIGNNCFKDCCELKEINLTKSVVEIGKDAFKDCSQLTSIIGNIGVCKKFKDSFKNTPLLKQLN